MTSLMTEYQIGQIIPDNTRNLIFVGNGFRRMAEAVEECIDRLDSLLMMYQYLVEGGGKIRKYHAEPKPIPLRSV